MKTQLTKIKKESATRLKELKSTLKECKTIADINKTWYLRQYITPANAKKELSLAELKRVIIARFEKLNLKRVENDIKEIEQIFAAGEISEITIQIEWKCNRTWGSNPTAEARVKGEQYEYFKSSSISGCGYDKQSTAFADAINQSLAFRKLMLKGSKKLGNEYGFSGGKLSAGVGISCYYRIFERLGYKMTQTANGSNFDAYLIVKK